MSSLADLQQTIADGVDGFSKAAEAVKATDLKNLFQGYAAERVVMAEQLAAFNPEEKKGTTVVGALHRGWINLKGALTAGDDHAILAECERGEEHALKVFRDELDESVPASARPIVDSIASRIQAVHDTVKQFRDQAKAA